MSETTFASSSVSPKSPIPDASAEKAEHAKKKKKSKVRSAWISFIGRIVAQIFGAVATVMLGLHVVQNYLPSSQASEPPLVAVDQPASPVALPRPVGVKALAVLPFENYSGDARQDAFSDGLTEALIAEFAQVPALRVTSRTSSMHFRDERGLLPSIARQLGVDLVIEGSVVRAGDRVRITAQLIDAGSDLHLWSRTYEPGERDVLSLHSAVAKAIVRDVRAAVFSAEQHRVARRGVAGQPANE